MFIPHRSVSSDILRAVIEEFVSREGTDYGSEYSLDSKVDAVRKQLDQGKARLFFDSQSETCDIVSVASARYRELLAKMGS
jgi:uncharacterized protein YheU (UPF0270 family)